MQSRSKSENVSVSGRVLQLAFNMSVLFNVWGGRFLAGNQGNHQNFNLSLLINKLGLVFMGMKQFFLKTKIQNGRLKKKVIFQN